MKDFAPEKIRNVAIVGHGSCGKTSLTSAFLYDAGATTRLTKVENGNTVTDYDPDEIERQISINSAVCHMEWSDHKINAVDCPGYMNFLWDTRASLRAVDAGVVIVCGVAGVEVGTEKVWAMMEELERPRILVINKLDRENANYEKAVQSIHNFFGRQAVPVHLPIGEAGHPRLSRREQSPCAQALRRRRLGGPADSGGARRCRRSVPRRGQPDPDRSLVRRAGGVDR